MEKKVLNLLILEDNPDDAALAVRELEQEGFTLEWSRVETKKAFRDALDKNPDLILADYKVPSFNGMDALKLQQEIAPEIPLVIVSGTIGEELAVECMKAGALDYVLKDKLFRLGPVIKRALVEAEVYQERKQAEEQLHCAHEELQHAYNRLQQSRVQLVQSEKMSAVGILVAGVAHELNNPLMGMLNYAQYCIKHTDKDDRRYSVLRDIEHETRRCVDIVQNLLTFSHMETGNGEPYQKTSCVVLLERVLKLLSYRIERGRVLLTQHISEGTPDIRVAANKIQQVFLNLIANALDALEESDKKEIHISLLQKGEFVQVGIADTGCGIAPEKLQKIFDPFFTTKPVGKGTGLGLSTSRAIIEEHAGEITCESKPGTGTKFKVSLPI